MSVLVLLFLGLQIRLWIGEDSIQEVRQLRQALIEQRAENEQLRQRNESLEADVLDLKTGVEAIEERARAELGMIGEDEVFFQIVDQRKKNAQ